jgi:hypothetical protein
LFASSVIGNGYSRYTDIHGNHILHFVWVSRIRIIRKKTFTLHVNPDGGKEQWMVCSKQRSRDAHEHPCEHESVHGRWARSHARIDKRHGEANRLVQARQQRHVRSIWERSTEPARVGVLRVIQRGSVVISIKRKDDAARTVVLQRLLWERFCALVRERSGIIRCTGLVEARGAVGLQ